MGLMGKVQVGRKSLLNRRVATGMVGLVGCFGSSVLFGYAGDCGSCFALVFCILCSAICAIWTINSSRKLHNLFCSWIFWEIERKLVCQSADMSAELSI
jgi:hypothetical protein